MNPTHLWDFWSYLFRWIAECGLRASVIDSHLTEYCRQKTKTKESNCKFTACVTEEFKPLVKSACEPAPKCLFCAPYQELSTRHDFCVKICTGVRYWLIIRISALLHRRYYGGIRLRLQRRLSMYSKIPLDDLEIKTSNEGEKILKIY